MRRELRRFLDEQPRLSLRALEDPAFRDEFRSSHVVFGFHRRRNKYVLFWGLESFRFIASFGEGQELCFRVFEVDQQTAEVEVLAAACETLLGGCDYRGPEAQG